MVLTPEKREEGNGRHGWLDPAVWVTTIMVAGEDTAVHRIILEIERRFTDLKVARNAFAFQCLPGALISERSWSLNSNCLQGALTFKKQLHTVHSCKAALVSGKALQGCTDILTALQGAWHFPVNSSSKDTAAVRRVDLWRAALRGSDLWTAAIRCAEGALTCGQMLWDALISEQHQL